MMLHEPLCRRLLGWPASESGRLCRGDRGHGRGHRRRRALMLAILLVTVLSAVRRQPRCSSRKCRCTSCLRPTIPTRWRASLIRRRVPAMFPRTSSRAHRARAAGATGSDLRRGHSLNVVPSSDSCPKQRARRSRSPPTGITDTGLPRTTRESVISRDEEKRANATAWANAVAQLCAAGGDARGSGPAAPR